MNVRVPSVLALIGLSVLPTLALTGCDKKAPAKADKPAAKHDDHDGHDHGDGHNHGEEVALGSQTIGAFTVKVARDGAVTAGKEASFDVSVEGGKPSAIRVWIGAQDAAGAVKSKAEAGKEGWHVHAEAPSPIPAGAKLWVEVENDKGESAVGGFDLKL